MAQRVRPAFVLWTICAIALAVSPAAGADGKLVPVETFRASGAELIVAHFTDPDAAKAKAKVGLIGIAAAGRNSFAVDYAAWLKLIELTGKAHATKAKDWTVVGTLSETGTQDVAQLTVSAGAGVSLVIASPKNGSVTYVLDRREVARFQKGLRQVRDYLAR